LGPVPRSSRRAGAGSRARRLCPDRAPLPSVARRRPGMRSRAPSPRILARTAVLTARRSRARSPRSTRSTSALRIRRPPDSGWRIRSRRAGAPPCCALTYCAGFFQVTVSPGRRPSFAASPPFSSSTALTGVSELSNASDMGCARSMIFATRPCASMKSMSSSM